MKLFDLLLMSISNLWKRKLRTVLTVLGVVIGITSIVVMVALGNGLKESMLESYSSYNSMTQITVNSRSGGGYYEAAVSSSSSSNSSSSSTQTEDKLLNDAAIQELLALEHVESVQPRLQFQQLRNAVSMYQHGLILSVLPKRNCKAWICQLDKERFQRMTGN